MFDTAKTDPRETLVIREVAAAKQALDNDGFAHIPSSTFEMDAETRQSWETLIQSFNDLPADPNDESGMRKRRYGRYLYFPSADMLFEQPPVEAHDGQLKVEYIQPLSKNSVDGGKRRLFTPLHPVTRSNRALRDLIRADYKALPARSEWRNMPVTVGVHQVKIEPRWGEPGVSSPNCLHQDGEPFTFVHLARKHNITGGLNYVAVPEAAGYRPENIEWDVIHARFTLERPLDTFVVDDQRVSHHVEEVYPIFPNEAAERSVFLIDFTPNMPQYV
jgi:hypothetical protein